MCVNYRIHSFRMIHLHSSTTRQPQIQFTHGNYVNERNTNIYPQNYHRQKPFERKHLRVMNQV